jgi:single-strand DNA-binding protein
MAGSINKVILVGNLGSNPEIRSTQSGNEIASFSIATSEQWKDKATGEKKTKTEWHRIVIFQQGLVNIAKQYLKKGAKIYLEGSLQTRKWTDSNNNEKYTTEVVLQGYNSNFTMLDNSGSTNDSYPQGSSNGNNNSPFPDQGSFNNSSNTKAESNNKSNISQDIDDEIPF